VPRTLLSQFLKRPEAAQVGVYFLFGSGADDTARCYIGQSGNVGARLQNHTGTKDFWTKAMVAVSLTNEWTSTHVAYLEWLSLKQAAAAGRYELMNGNQASNPHTPEPLEADCQEFQETIAVLPATLGAPVLEPVQRRSSAAGDDAAEEDQEQLFFREAGCSAAGYQTPEGLLVLAGSRGRPGLRPSAPTNVGRQRAALHADGVIRMTDTELVFLKDHLFTSPSAAGGVVIGGSNNGRTSWRDAQGRSINDLEVLSLTAASRETDET
jgi:hypothetical protein